MHQDPIRVGIAGLGRSGWDIHARLLEPLHENYRVVAVVDADESRRDEAAQRFDCATYSDYEELLNDANVELVVVALPNSLHTRASLDALDAEKHVVCEKPMATSLEDADRMVAATDQSPQTLTIFQQRRYNPDFVKVCEVIDSGILGRIVQIRLTEAKFSRRWDWQTLQKFGGGTLNNTGPHYLDQALQLFGPSLPAITCKLERTLTLGDADDHVKILLTGKNAPTIDIEVTSCCTYPADTWLVMGTQGGLHGTTRELHWRWVLPEEMPVRELDIRPTPDRSYNRDQLSWHEDSWSLDGNVSNAYSQFYLDLFQTIRHDAPLKITPQSVRRVIWLQEKCHELSPIPQEIW